MACLCVHEAASHLSVPAGVAEFLAEKLAAEGISLREDLAVLAADGSLRPLANLLLGDCAPPRADEVLLCAALAANRSLEAWLFSTDRAAAKRPLLPPEPTPRTVPLHSARVRAVSQRALAAVNRQIARLAAEDFSARPCTPAPAGLSLAAKEDARMTAVVNSCYTLLYACGDEVPRFRQAFRAKEGLHTVLGETDMAILTDVLRGGYTSPAGLDKARRGALRWIAYARTSRIAPFAPTEWQLAAYLRDQWERGSTAPTQALASLAWLNKAFGLEFDVSSPLVRSQLSRKTSAVRPDAPLQAATATPDAVRGMERLVATAPTLVLRIYAGAFACLAHACLRVSDLQHSIDLVLTEDAPTGRCWRMKRKSSKVMWAALRHGFTGAHWAAAWSADLERAGLPGHDFVLRAPGPNFASFRPAIARYEHFCSAMRVLLSLPPISVAPADALQLTPHSWRHLYPTAGRQLEVPEAQLDDIGHWATGSGMPRAYDSAACVSELIAKSKIATALRAGWTVAAPGCVPKTPPPPMAAPGTPGGPAPSQEHEERGPPYSRRKTAEHIRRTTVSVLPKGKGVLNTTSSLMHLHSGGTTSACGMWACGSPTNPAVNARFTDDPALQSTTSTKTSQCKRCFTSRLLEALGMREEDDVPTLAQADDSSSASDSDEDDARPVLLEERRGECNFFRFS